MRRLMAIALLAAAPVVSGAEEIRLGIVGLDTSHVTAFTELMHNPKHKDHVPGAKVVAGFKGGSPDIPSSITRVEGPRRLYSFPVVPVFVRAARAAKSQVRSSQPLQSQRERSGPRETYRSLRQPSLMRVVLMLLVKQSRLPDPQSANG